MDIVGPTNRVSIMLYVGQKNFVAEGVPGRHGVNADIGEGA